MNRGGNLSQPLTVLLFVVMVTVVDSARERKLMAIEKVIGRTLAGQPKKTPETTFGVAKVFTIMLLGGFVVLNVALLVLMIALM